MMKSGSQARDRPGDVSEPSLTTDELRSLSNGLLSLTAGRAVGILQHPVLAGGKAAGLAGLMARDSGSSGFCVTTQVYRDTLQMTG